MRGVKVGGSCLCLQPLLPHPPPFSSPQTLASLFSSIKTNKRIGSDCFCDSYNLNNNHIISHQSDHHLSTFLGTAPFKLSRRRSLDDDFSVRPRRRKGSKEQALRRRPLTASFDGFTHHHEADEFVRRLRESAFDDSPATDISPDSRGHQQEADTTTPSPFSSVRGTIGPSAEPPWPAIWPEPPNWPDRDGIVPGAVETKAINSVDLPVSRRTIKRKEEEARRGSGESPCSSVNKAFSSMVFIIRELHSYTLQMREILFSENLQGILTRVQTEMNASFVWLFQQIFSCTPTLMVYVMLLLANFTVYSITPNLDAMTAAAAAAGSPNPPAHTTTTVDHDDASSIKSFFIGRTASVGGNGCGGGKAKPMTGATNDGGRSYGSSSMILSDGKSTARPGEHMAEAAVTEEEEVAVWNGIVEEASRMKASLRDESLMDPGTLQRLVSPVTVELEPEEYSEYLQTELMYHKALSQDPDNVLLLSNFAQFLFLVLHDHDRAECYHKRAIGVRPADAEALNRYASFLWLARKDLEAAEETYLEAIAADPGNSHYAASYAHFLWSTGGEETCYPLDGSDATSCESM